MDTNEIRALAGLAKLSLKEEELSRLSAEFEQIMQFVNKLSELDTTGVDAAAHAFQGGSYLREDVITPSLAHERVLSNAPQEDGDGFVIPMVIQGGNV